MRPPEDPTALLSALIDAPPPEGGYRLPAAWISASTALSAMGPSALFQDLGYEIHTGAEDSRKARDRFILRLRLAMGATPLRSRLLAARWTVDQASADFLRARDEGASLTIEGLPEPGMFRAELDLPRPPLPPDALRALPSTMPAFAPLSGLFNLGRVRAFGVRRHASGALLARADLRFGARQVDHAREVAVAAGLRPSPGDDARWRGRSEAGPIHLYLMGDSACVHLGPEPPMAGAWPDDPDEG